MLPNAERACAWGVAIVGLGFAAQAGVQGFAALVTPPRFELAAKPGEKLRQVIEITNAAAQPAKYRLKTADWTLEPNASISFDESLKPGSCRPWVAIESRQISVGAGGKYRYRFPVSGRLGVIVYVTVGDARPNLEVVGARVSSGDEAAPVLMVRNSGTAHGRLAGFLSGTDAAGKKLEFTPTTLPILPGETRAIALTPYVEGNESVKVAYPITIRGKLEWGDKSVAFEQSFAR